MCKVYQGCLVKVGNGIELDTVASSNPDLRRCSRTFVVIKLRRPTALHHSPVSQSRLHSPLFLRLRSAISVGLMNLLCNLMRFNAFNSPCKVGLSVLSWFKAQPSEGQLGCYWSWPYACTSGSTAPEPNPGCPAFRQFDLMRFSAGVLVLLCDLMRFNALNTLYKMSLSVVSFLPCHAKILGRQLKFCWSWPCSSLTYS